MLADPRIHIMQQMTMICVYLGRISKRRLNHYHSHRRGCSISFTKQRGIELNRLKNEVISAQ
jgi:hypothetical protein